MQALVNALPELLPIIQTHLLDLLSLGLTRKPYREKLSTAASHSLNQAIQLGACQNWLIWHATDTQSVLTEVLSRSLSNPANTQPDANLTTLNVSSVCIGCCFLPTCQAEPTAGGLPVTACSGHSSSVCLSEMPSELMGPSSAWLLIVSLHEHVWGGLHATAWGHFAWGLAGEVQGPALIRIALLTLGTFDFGQCNLLEFVRDHVITYLDDSDVSIRKSAAAAAAQVLQRHVARQAQLRQRAAIKGPFMPITSVGPLAVPLLICLLRGYYYCCYCGYRVMLDSWSLQLPAGGNLLGCHTYQCAYHCVCPQAYYWR